MRLTEMQKTLSNAAQFLSSPVSFGLVFLWILNDHIGKSQFPSSLTGKVSDITGLIVFPFLLTDLALILSQGKFREKILFLLANLAIVILFSIINWNQDWNNWVYANFFGNQNGTADKTDLLCIPFCLLANFYFYRKYLEKEIAVSTRIKFLHLIAIILSSLAFMNTSTAEKKMPMQYPDQSANPDLPIISLAKPISSTLYYKGEELSFVWLTEGEYTEFLIQIYSSSRKLEKEILLKTSQLQKRPLKGVNAHYYIYTEDFFLPPGVYWIVLIGSKDNAWKKDYPSKDLFYSIYYGQCNTMNISCTAFTVVSFIE